MQTVDALYVDRSNRPILSTSINRVNRDDTLPRQTTVWQISKVCAVLVQHIRRRLSTDPTCAYTTGDVLRLPGSHRLRLKHEALNLCRPNMGPASQMLCQHYNNIASGHNMTSLIPRLL